MDGGLRRWLLRGLMVAGAVGISGGGAASAERAPSPRVAGSDGQTLPVRVEALPKARYYARCHIRTFRDYDGRSAYGYANVYVIDASGPFHGFIPSPNAQCVVAKISGPGDVVLHIIKLGDHQIRATTPMTWVRLNVW